MQWDLYCRVIDNFGDIGVCWRLAADLAARGEQVRLWTDDASALRWMAPPGATAVAVLGWPTSDTGIAPGDVVIEAFGCALPDATVGSMARAARPPLWINLEHLSAEDFVERSHKLPSPQVDGPGAGLCKWFFYPGFTPHTGGLIREPDLSARQGAFDAAGWLGARSVSVAAGESVVSLFCYEQPALPSLLDQCAQHPTLLLATAGHAARQVSALLGPTLRRGRLRAVLLPAMAQADYDHLLWASDINFVRGEDSFVRAQWAGKPFVWQIYPQRDGAHRIKLDAFLKRLDVERPVRTFWDAWNAPELALPALPELLHWGRRCGLWREALRAQPDLTTHLLEFAVETR